MIKIKNLFKHPGSYLLAVFLLINIICGQHGGNNPNSRYAHLRAMSHDASFNIKPLVIGNKTFWTDDWASPDPDHYYSNKAPGSAFLALPSFFILDSLSRLTWKTEKKGPFFNAVPSRTTRKLSSIITQVIFFITLYLLLLRRNQLADVFKNRIALIGFLFLFCFANTSANYMNTMFGHGLAAVLTFWFVNSLLVKNPFQLGFSFGIGLLNDYSFALFLPAAIIYLFFAFPREIKTYVQFTFGGIPSGLLWIWYHFICFGSPFAIANKYQNPKYIDVQASESIGGIFNTSIDLGIAFELLFGLKRGLLITQPWVLVAIIVIAINMFNQKLSKENKTFIGLNLLTFFFIFLMNISFGGWHGGSTIGPRYLSIIFPWLAISLSLLHTKGLIQKPSRYGIILTSIYSFLFFNLVNATTILSEDTNLLAHLLSVFQDENMSKSLMRFTISLLAVGGAVYIEKKRYDLEDGEVASITN